jgi:predicted RNase H-like nuclease (RuvC/YqgF family)
MNWDILLDPRVLVTFIICAILGALGVWIALMINNRRHHAAVREQRQGQEEAVSRILESVAKSKDEIITDYETQIQALRRELEEQEKENKRLKDRVAQGGLLGMFGGQQRQVISSLLLENEQLHELLAQKQEQLRDLMQDMSTRLVERLDEQTQESARAVRYKQVLLSAFLKQEEAQRLLDQFIAEGHLQEGVRPELNPPDESITEPELEAESDDGVQDQNSES